MMRKTTLILLGAAAGAVMALLATEPGTISIGSTAETPAAKAGILANDLIIKLDDEQVQGMTMNQAVEKMRGPVNTKVKLTIMRKGQDKPIEVSLTREVIRVR